jgi:hypothetical protein
MTGRSETLKRARDLPIRAIVTTVRSLPLRSRDGPSGEGDLDKGEEIVDDVAQLARENEVRLFLPLALRMLGGVYVQSAPV